MVELITDRTQYHVTLLNRLRKKPWGSMTASEQSSWNGDAAKGAYNYTDLNRVETAVGELAGELGLTLTTKTNWTLWDIPTRSEMERYLGNVVAIRDACPGSVEFPTLPSSMNSLTYEGANSIEKVLSLVYEKLGGGSGVIPPNVFYTTNEPQIDQMVFDFSEVGPNVENITIGDWIVTPSGKVYVVRFVEHYGIEAEYDETLNPDSGGGSDDPIVPESADFIRSGEVYCGEVL